MKNVRLSYIIQVMGWGLKTLMDKGIGWEGLNFGRTEWLAPPENDPATPMLIEAVTVPKLPWIREGVWRPWQ